MPERKLTARRAFEEDTDDAPAPLSSLSLLKMLLLSAVAAELRRPPKALRPPAMPATPSPTATTTASQRDRMASAASPAPRRRSG